MENYHWLQEYLRIKQGVTEDYKAEWDWQRYKVGEKMFAATMHPSENYAPEYAGRDLISLKCDPFFSELLQKEHSEIMPGFYLDKRTWISIDLGGNLPHELLKKLVDDSYHLVFQKLTRKLQRQILGEFHP